MHTPSPHLLLHTRKRYESLQYNTYEMLRLERSELPWDACWPYDVLVVCRVSPRNA